MRYEYIIVNSLQEIDNRFMEVISILSQKLNHHKGTKYKNWT